MIISITVCFNPSLLTLREQFRSLRDQVFAMLVVANGPTSVALADFCQEMGANLIQLETNTGIAHAQNLGIQEAMRLGASMVLLMDQDSEPQKDMVRNLENALRVHSRAAAAGPSTLDLRSREKTYFLTDFSSRPNAWTPSTNAPGQMVEVAYLIASGSLLRINALRDTGLMRDDWFIDLIDTEWCLRARAKGWKIIGVADACLGHRLGDEITKIWFLRERKVPHHSPLRHYYMFRNTILLLKEPFVAWHWKRHHAMRIVKLFFFFLVFAPQRKIRMQMMLQGLVDGIRGCTGAKI